MIGIELLENYPKAAKLVAGFYNNKLIESMSNSSDEISEEFKEMLKQQSFDNQYVATFIDSNPRFLFDVFDDNKIYIQTTVDLQPFIEPRFNYSVSGAVASTGSSISFGSRIEAEKQAIETAFQILNEKL
jgi:hypothetical protein